MLVIKRVLQCCQVQGLSMLDVQNTNELPHKNRKPEESVARAGARESASKHNKVKCASFLFEFSTHRGSFYGFCMVFNLYSAPSRILL